MKTKEILIQAKQAISLNFTHSELHGSVREFIQTDNTLVVCWLEFIARVLEYKSIGQMLNSGTYWNRSITHILDVEIQLQDELEPLRELVL